MTPRFQSPAVVPAEPGFLATRQIPGPPGAGFSVGATSAEQVHSLLRLMPDGDWARLKTSIQASLDPPLPEAELELVERLFRRQESLGGSAGRAVGRIVQGIYSHPALLCEVRQIRERMREWIRFVLRETAEARWAAFKKALETNPAHAAGADDVAVLELVFRVGESVSNIEIAARVAAHRNAERGLDQSQVGGGDASIRSTGNPGDTAGSGASRARSTRFPVRSGAVEHRAENTLACRYVRPSAAFQHARNTVFRLVDWILGDPDLLARAIALKTELDAVPALARERMRWALHRMPVADRIQVIRMIPLNTVLVFQDLQAGGKAGGSAFRVTRDRRLAYDSFVRGHGDEELAADFGLTINAVKNAMGEIMQALTSRPIARQLAHSYLSRVEGAPSMTLGEVRRHMKLLGPEGRVEIVSKIPACAWKARQAIQLHKHLFLDYLSGDWVLETLVEDYNLGKRHRPTGAVKPGRPVTVRGANAAITGMLLKIALEPELRQRLRSLTPPGGGRAAEDTDEERELTPDDFLPPAVSHAGCPG